jgi:hypothetical protein
MSDRRVRYVTLAYGDAPGVYRQSLMLLVSLMAHAPDPFEVVVATDRPERYVWFGTRVEIEYVDRSLLEAWKGSDPFSMRQKIALLRAAWPDRGHIVLLDADVLARRNLTPFVAALVDGRLFMHKREYQFGRTRRVGNRRLWHSLRGRTFGTWTINPDDAMWNSGVIGVGAADRPLIDEALQLYDAMGIAGVRHFATEQLVEGVVLGRTGRLRSAEEWFAHYWGNRSAYDAEIARRLADAFIDGLSVKEAAARYRERPIDLPVEVRRTRSEKLRRWIGGT